MTRPVGVGAVMYDPKVSVIWEIIGDFFEQQGCPIDVTFFSNYELQVTALVAGELDIAWNSPLAYLDAERRLAGARAVAMRDTDRDRVSYLVGRVGDGVRGVADLRGRTVAVGASDSPQATLIPLGLLRQHGLGPETDVGIRRFDLLVGKHGDHIGGEREAVRALLRGQADAACLIDSNHLAFAREGTVPRGATRVLARTSAYDHCNFTAFDDGPVELIERFRTLLLEMSYGDPEIRPLLDLEGLKQWVDGRVTGYSALATAVDRFGTIDAFIDRVQKLCA
jgi:ABC-type phosphate/phosphonate transport system substrate-binding protein